MILLPISESSVHRLARWASVGRTIDQAVRWLDFLQQETNDEDAIEAVPYAIRELQDLKQALNEAGQAAHNWLATPAGQAWFEAAGRPPLGARNVS